MRASQRSFLAAGAVVTALVLAACAGTPDDRTARSFAAAGAWADDFAEFSRTASSFEAAILDDGVITASELADAQARNRTCMADAGYVYREFEDGTGEIVAQEGEGLASTDTALAAKQACARRFDSAVTYLHNEIRRNPDKLDEAEITVACLRASGLVGRGYSERRWRTEDDEGHFSFDDLDERAVQCRLDPLGLWRNG